MRFGLVLTAALLSLTVAATPALADRDAVAFAAKGKKVACKGGKIAVKLGKRTSCLPFARAFPDPKPVDLRLAYLQQTLKFDPAKAVKGKKRKRARTLQSGFGAAGRRAQKKLLKLIPKALAFVDQKGGKASSSAFPPRPALASGACQVGPAGPTGQTGGATIGALGDNGGYIDAPVGGGLRVRVTFVLCGGVNSFHVPECPTANGSVDASGTGEFKATIEIWEGDRLKTRNSSTFEDKAKVHGEVGADAKLRSLKVEHTQEVFIVASGGIVIRGGITRAVQIGMPGGRYDPAGATIRPFGDAVSADTGASGFASTAAAAINSFQAAEPRWSSFDRRPLCAEPVFSPDSNTTKLARGKTGQLGIYAKARSDNGRASEANWTLLSPLNSSFSPTATQSAAPSIQYTVSNNPQGDQVRVAVKFTSTAGVGEGSWTEPLEPGQAINHLNGTFGGFHETSGGTLQTWSGSANFERIGPSPGAGSEGIFEMQSGSASLTVSGETRRGEPEYTCDIDGQMAFPELGKIGAILVRSHEGTPGYEYSIEVFLPGTVPPEEGPLEDEVTVEYSNCGERSEELNGTTEEIPAAWMFFFFETENSPDGLDFSGSIEEVVGSVTREQHWSLHGSP